MLYFSLLYLFLTERINNYVCLLIIIINLDFNIHVLHKFNEIIFTCQQSSLDQILTAQVVKTGHMSAEVM